MQFNTIEEILEDFRLGKMVLILDDEDRENEGDLIIAADVVTPQHITFFAREACGLICLTITERRAKQLNLPLMVDRNSSQHETNFTVSIEAADGITTGISAADRARTVRTAVAKNARPEDLVMPGHIFPLIAKRGGVLTRAGHTEAGCDLARLSGYEPASVIVEVMNEDGSMAKGPELEQFAKRHQLKIGTIADLIHYRALHDTTIERIDQRSVATEFGEFNLTTFRDSASDQLHFAMSKGSLSPEAPCVVRVQTISFLRDVLGTLRPGFKGSWSTQAALKKIASENSGVLVLVSEQLGHEAELEQIRAYPDIPAATRSVSESGVYRVIGAGSQILKDLGVGKMRLLANPSKYNAISGFDLEVVEFIEFDDH
jgi:3,4-dihydroxy 2-butanone 4-phosphate synthase/GTP cyclohydrolase II